LELTLLDVTETIPQSETFPPHLIVRYEIIPSNGEPS
jgi:hypothetical protein